MCGFARILGETLGELRIQTWVMIVSTAKNPEGQIVSNLDGGRRGANKRTLYNEGPGGNQGSKL